MLTQPEKPKKSQLPKDRGLAVPIDRLMRHYAKSDGHQRRARKPKVQGKRTKKGLTQFLFDMFEQNEMAARIDKLTNEKMELMLMEEFPNHDPLIKGLQVGGKGGINDYRRRYNCGVLRRDVLPTRISFRYNKDGLRVDTRTGRRLMSVQDQAKYEQHFRDRFHNRKRPGHPQL